MKKYCTFLSLGRYGRFANQIFQIAGTIGIARRNGLEPVFPKWVNYDHAERFGSNEPVDVWRHLANPLPELPTDFKVDEASNAPIPWGYHEVHLNNALNHNLSGHLQSYKYFSHCIDEVRKALTFKNEFPLRKYVAVHVRRGDYDDLYHPRLGLKYYRDAMQYFPEDTVFQVFSDDIRSVAKEFYNTGQDPDYIERKFRFVNLDEPTYDYIESFKLMKSCSGFIIGNSSYSAAAAMLNDLPGKKVIAPKRWFGEAHAGIDAKDIYCDDWIVI
jgi:hypothetical protein